MTDTNKGMFRNLTRYGDAGFSRYMRRAFLHAAGFDAADLDRPVIGIADTSSDFNPCHRQMPELVAAVKRGVMQAGGLPLAFPTISLHEILISPTTMYYRNLMAMETEEMIRAQPMDAVVLMGGCDKTVPAQALAAVSADIPAVHMVAGPMLTGRYRGERLGACTDCRRLWTEHRAGRLSAEEIAQVEKELVPTAGTCMVMGTASTMGLMMATLGLMPLSAATAPAATGQRLAAGTAAGRLAVELARSGPRPREVLTRPAFINALTVLMAAGGSTNAVVHLLALARRAGVDLELADFDAVSRRVPVLVDVKPAGSGYMEDLHHAGGLPVLLNVLKPLLDLSVRGVEGRPLEDLLKGVPDPGDWQQTIRTLDAPLKPAGGLRVVTGSLAPDGAVIKTAAADPRRLTHTGPAVVFEGPEDAADRIDDPSLGITPDHVMVLRGAGPIGAGMPEAGSLPIPKYLAAQGVRDMVRVSDGRMSGTAYGSVVLHVSPESAVGGPLALVRNGDSIRLDVPEGRLDLLVAPEELARRRETWTPPPAPTGGYARLHASHVLQAHLGADLDLWD